MDDFQDTLGHVTNKNICRETLAINEETIYNNIQRLYKTE